MTIAVDRTNGKVLGQLVQNFNRDGKPQLRLLTRDGKYLNFDQHTMKVEEVR